MKPEKLTPEQILVGILDKLGNEKLKITDAKIKQRLEYVCRCLTNRAGVRLLMSCMLAKLDNDNVDPRKPYTEIGGADCFSGRTYDEGCIGKFCSDLHLPVNQTTAFLTPTLRNMDQPLTTKVELVGRPRDLYVKTLELLDDVAKKRTTAELVMIETVRILITMREEKQARLKSLLTELGHDTGALPLSSESIVTLIVQHLACKNSSRLPVLIVAAAYNAAGKLLGENILPLNAHNAADKQTGSVGDVEICLMGDDNVVTAYEMKMKPVKIDDIDNAVTKIHGAKWRINNYLFITTDAIDDDVAEYAATFYEATGGTEIAILDCIGFLRHFLHFFHRLRGEFLQAYQDLVLREPDSAVSASLKETFLSLRHTAESEG